jgi:hypothetical protein
MKSGWMQIIAIWVLVAIATILVTLSAFSRNQAFESYGAILASSCAAVALIHLFKSRPEGIVRELIYVAGGSYLMLAIASSYLFLRG